MSTAMSEQSEPVHSNVTSGTAPDSDSAHAELSKELIMKLRAQIEFYFSPHNLSRDMYLVNLLSSNGCVMLNTIASFPKVRELLCSGGISFDEKGNLNDYTHFTESLRDSEVVGCDGTWVWPKISHSPFHPFSGHHMNPHMPPMNGHPHMGMHHPLNGPQPSGINMLPITHPVNPQPAASAYSQMHPVSVPNRPTGKTPNEVKTNKSSTPPPHYQPMQQQMRAGGSMGPPMPHPHMYPHTYVAFQPGAMHMYPIPHGPPQNFHRANHPNNNIQQHAYNDNGNARSNGSRGGGRYVSGYRRGGGNNGRGYGRGNNKYGNNQHNRQHSGGNDQSNFQSRQRRFSKNNSNPQLNLMDNSQTTAGQPGKYKYNNSFVNSSANKQKKAAKQFTSMDFPSLNSADTTDSGTTPANSDMNDDSEKAKSLSAGNYAAALLNKSISGSSLNRIEKAIKNDSNLVDPGVENLCTEFVESVNVSQVVEKPCETDSSKAIDDEPKVGNNHLCAAPSDNLGTSEVDEASDSKSVLSSVSGVKCPAEEVKSEKIERSSERILEVDDCENGHQGNQNQGKNVWGSKRLFADVS